MCRTCAGPDQLTQIGLRPPVDTVPDEIVVECRREGAEEAAAWLMRCLEEAMASAAGADQGRGGRGLRLLVGRLIRWRRRMGQPWDGTAPWPSPRVRKRRK